MNNFSPPVSFKGKYVGILVLTILQLLNGAIHAIIGATFIVLSIGAISYNIYTFFYGIINLLFLYGLWTGKKSGWIGTILVSGFVFLIDVFTILNIQIIAGAPKNAAIGEIVISLALIAYLFHPKIRKIFLQTN